MSAEQNHSTAPRWRVIGASVRGSAHQRQNQPCQDAHQYRILTNGTLLMAVADGAGSAPRAAEGAQAVVRQAVAVCAERLADATPRAEDEWQTLLHDIFAAARARLVELAAQTDEPLNAFATTLSFAVAHDDWLASARVGDGVLVFEAADETLHVPAPPQRGEYANETYFLTMNDALKHVEVQVVRQPLRAIALTTDGLMRLALKLPSYSAHAPFFRPLLAFAANAADGEQAKEELSAFLSSERVNERTDDDRTLVLATRMPEPPAAEAVSPDEETHA